MRSLFLVGVLVLALTACAPRLTATPERDGEEVTIILAATDSLYAVSLSVLNATSDDPRCVVFDEVDAGCLLGDIPAGEELRVEFTLSGSGALYCAAFGFTEANQSVSSYRPFRCEGG